MIIQGRNGYGNDSHCVYLTHSDEQIVSEFTDTFTDSSYSGTTNTSTLSGDTSIPTQDTSIYKFASKSWDMSGSTIWRYIEISGETNDNWNFGTEDFCIDFYIYLDDVPPNNSESYHSNGVYESDNNYFGFLYDDNIDTSGSGFTFLISGSTIIELQFDPEWVQHVWYHCAIVRHNEKMKIYWNGKMATYYNLPVGYQMPNINESYLIGAISSRDKIPSNKLSVRNRLSAHYDEFRISKGNCRWTSDFVPPNRQY